MLTFQETNAACNGDQLGYFSLWIRGSCNAPSALPFLCLWATTSISWLLIASLDVLVQRYLSFHQRDAEESE